MPEKTVRIEPDENELVLFTFDEEVKLVGFWVAGHTTALQTRMVYSIGSKDPLPWDYEYGETDDAPWFMRLTDGPVSIKKNPGTVFVLFNNPAVTPIEELKVTAEILG